jgi:hypothetical protein
MGVVVGPGPAAGRSDLLVKFGFVRIDMGNVRSDCARTTGRQIRPAPSDLTDPTCRQIRPVPGSLTGHVTSNRDLARPNIETNRAAMHATEAAIDS